MVKFKDNNPRLQQEIDQLRSENNELWEMIVNNLSPYYEHHFGKDLVITMIYRSQEEQDRIYQGKRNSSGREYDKNPWKSPHQFWHSVDLRSRDLDNYLNTMYNPLNYYRFTAMNHNVGLGDHHHIQFLRK